MKCSIHRSDPGAGVCAFCLHERLSTLAASITTDPSLEIGSIQKPSLPGSPRKSCRESSIPAAGARIAGNFSLSSPSLINNVESLKSSRNPASCLSALIRCRRMKIDSNTSPQGSPEAVEAARGRARKPRVPPPSGRGMSPAARGAMELRSPDVGNAKEASPSRWLSTPSPLRQKARTAATTTPNYNGQKNRNPQSVSGISLFLSPMVRPSSGNRRSRTPAEATNWSELRAGAGAGAGVPSFLVPSRSRKLADFGKVW
ncbi:hypothetical protein AXF42_Ash014841 [Apostasia shenzhenica]|uniref:Uncharacterized protein n=1 Tax=Apostasia shenzhenica TaxID=1088818 RepID=A0A2I0AL95_9ASPA|nr:hypothetical protein AXF42_Ash014841 [Apostasia shenzhenica]